eukprot:555631-Pleurochrysis_carterae.AAC.2
MESLSFRKLPLDSALRLMISFIKLPGEAQKIDRIIEAFAHQYTECNPGVLDHPDTAVIIAFSLAMLNTDAHNPAIKKERKMTLQQYRAQLRDCCKNGSPPDQEMLKGFYERVTRFEWQVPCEAATLARGRYCSWLLWMSLVITATVTTTAANAAITTTTTSTTTSSRTNQLAPARKPGSAPPPLPPPPPPPPQAPPPPTHQILLSAALAPLRPSRLTSAPPTRQPPLN